MTKAELEKAVGLMEEIAEGMMCLQGTVNQLARRRTWTEDKAATFTADLAILRDLSEDNIDDLASDVATKVSAFDRLTGSQEIVSGLETVRDSTTALVAAMSRRGAIGQEVEVPRLALRRVERQTHLAAKPMARRVG